MGIFNIEFRPGLALRLGDCTGICLIVEGAEDRRQHATFQWFHIPYKYLFKGLNGYRDGVGSDWKVAFSRFLPLPGTSKREGGKKTQPFNRFPSHPVICTVLVLRMAHMIWKETKQHPGTSGPDNMLGCCLVSFHFLWAILGRSIVQIWAKEMAFS